MGTRFRTMLAPINASTGDGRRFQSGAIELAAVPFPFEWVRERQGGHDGAVTVGAVQQTATLSVDQAVKDGWLSADAAKGMDGKLEGIFAQGELLDHVDREQMPELAEDVATVLALIEAGTLGPSVDLDSFEGVPVLEGTDEPVTWEQIEDYYEENGEEPKLELLITAGRVRAATLVSIPAFAETSRPMELIENEASDEEQAAADGEALALVASLGAPVALAPIGAYSLPTLAGPTPITWDFETGRVFGHIATWQTCHVGYADVCVTAPKDDSGAYAWFNRYPVETQDGTIWAGRITVGGKHASLSLAASGSMAHHDGLTVAAYVRAYEDEHGIAVSGTIEPHLTGTEIQTLKRRKVSGDWRETSGGELSLIEILALSPGPRASAEPGFPVPGTFSHRGRQTALTAALGPDSGQGTLTVGLSDRDIDAVLDRREKREAKRTAALAARTELAATMKTVNDDARAALAAAMEG